MLINLSGRKSQLTITVIQYSIKKRILLISRYLQVVAITAECFD